MFGRRRDEWWQRQLDRERAQAAAERQLLLDRIMFLTGATWTPPPAPEPTPAVEEDVFYESALSGVPPQYLDDE